MRLSGNGVVCVRGGREVFGPIGFEVAAGEAMQVTGRNGAGKSSLLRLIAGLVRIAGGQVGLSGGDPELTLPEQAHYLGHQDAVKPSLSAIENLRFWSDYLGGGGLPNDAALFAAGLDAVADLPAGYLSAGQRRRLSIARLLAVRRPLWLLDEPASALDAAGQAMLAETMARHLAGGGLIVAAVHGPIGLDGARELRLDAAVQPAAALP